MNLSRSNQTARQQWKVFYRTVRIARREHLKAFVDAMAFGVGFVMVTADGTIERLDPATVLIKPK